MNIVYKLTCTKNGKAYVGATNNLKQRLADHRSSTKRGSKCPIHCAIRKYGIDAFLVDVLYSSDDRQHVFNVMEPDFIKKHRTLISEGGYNLTPGGDGIRASYGHHHSAETKRKIGKGNKGKIGWNRNVPLKEEHKQKLSKEHNKEYVVEHINGKKCVVTGLRNWCKVMGLNEQTLRATLYRGNFVTTGAAEGWRVQHAN
jgi:group I intron endonuclease